MTMQRGVRQAIIATEMQLGQWRLVCMTRWEHDPVAIQYLAVE